MKKPSFHVKHRYLWSPDSQIRQSQSFGPDSSCNCSQPTDTKKHWPCSRTPLERGFKQLIDKEALYNDFIQIVEPRKMYPPSLQYMDTMNSIEKWGANAVGIHGLPKFSTLPRAINPPEPGKDLDGDGKCAYQALCPVIRLILFPRCMRRRALMEPTLQHRPPRSGGRHLG